MSLMTDLLQILELKLAWSEYQIKSSHSEQSYIFISCLENLIRLFENKIKSSAIETILFKTWKPVVLYIN